MKINKKWNNWWVFFIGVFLSLVIALFVQNYYLNSFLFSGSSWIGGGMVDILESYINSFLFLYTFFITFFYKAFSKNFKPFNLIYFLALPFLLYMSSFYHFLIFISLFVLGLVLGTFSEKLFRK